MPIFKIQEPDQCPLLGIPLDHRGHHHLLHHIAHGDSLEGHHRGGKGKSFKTIFTIYLQWYGGNLLCKTLMMIRTGGYILSSNLLVVLSIDRQAEYLIQTVLALTGRQDIMYKLILVSYIVALIGRHDILCKQF